MVSYFTSVLKVLPFIPNPHSSTLIHKIPRSFTSTPFAFSISDMQVPSSPLSIIFSHLLQNPNLVILMILLIISACFGIFSDRSKKLSKNPDNVFCSEIEDSPLSSVCTSPDVSGLTEAISIPDIGGLIVLDRLIDNGNFEKYFEVKGKPWKEGNKKVFLTQHKLDGHVYLVKVQDFQIIDERTELAILGEVSKYRRLNCRNVSRYITCWVEVSLGRVSLFIQTEKTEGVTLKEFIENGISSDDAAKILRKVAKGLTSVHGKGAVHGNLSLESVYIDNYQKVTIDKFEFAGDQEEDLLKFREIYKSVLGCVYKDSVRQAQEKILSDRFVRKTGIIQKLSI